MKINYLFIELVCSILLYSLVVKADSDFKGECQNLKNIAHDCKVDSQGKIIYIQMYNDEGLSDKDWEKLLSYKTIKELYLSGINRTGITQKIVDRIGKLTNLEKLEFGYYTIFDKNLKYDSFKNLSKVSELGIIGSEDEKTLEKNIIKNFKNLKNLDIRNAKFNKDIISEINSLTKIEKMKLYEIEMEDNLNYDLKNVYELEIDDSVIAKNFLGSLKNLKKLMMLNDIYIKQYHADEISTLSNLEEIEYKVHYSEKDVIDFSSFKNLKNLTRCLIEISYDNLKVKNINNIKNLHLSVLNKITQSNINEIGKLTNVVYLRIIIGESDLDIDFSPINKKNINELEIVGSNDKYDHDKVLKKHIIKVFSNIKILSFDNIDFNQSDIDDISGLTQLEGLKFQRCYWNKISIEPLNKLPKLKYVDFTNNSSIEGKTLTNDSLEKCLYSTYPELCIAKDMKCFTEEVKAALKPCSSSSNDKISTNGQCGVVNGICPSDECCSKYGYCGTSDKHCYSGCQPEYGKCKGTSSSTSKTTTSTKTKTTKSTTKTSSLPISTNDKCGPKDGRCPSDKCCSKYGWCGTSDSHCGSGCQSEFGKCKKSSTSTTTTSKKTTKKTTSKTKTTTKKTSTKKTTSKSSLPISTNDKCGPKDGRCPSGECCSKYGWCGTSDSHCGSGCQSDYGKCK